MQFCLLTIFLEQSEFPIVEMLDAWQDNEGRTEGKELSFLSFLEMPSHQLQQGWHCHKSFNGHISNFRTLYFFSQQIWVPLWAYHFMIQNQKCLSTGKIKSALCYVINNWSDFCKAEVKPADLGPRYFLHGRVAGSGQLQRGTRIYTWQGLAGIFSTLDMPDWQPCPPAYGVSWDLPENRTSFFMKYFELVLEERHDFRYFSEVFHLVYLGIIIFSGGLPAPISASQPPSIGS